MVLPAGCLLKDALQCIICGVHVTQIIDVFWKYQWWHFTLECIIILFYILHCGLTLFSINRRLSITLFLFALFKGCNKLNQFEWQTVFNSNPTILLVFNHNCSIDWSIVFIMACFREMTDHYYLHCADDGCYKSQLKCATQSFTLCWSKLLRKITCHNSIPIRLRPTSKLWNRTANHWPHRIIFRLTSKFR